MFFNQCRFVSAMKRASQKIFPFILVAVMALIGVSTLQFSFANISASHTQNNRTYEIFERDYPKGVIEITQIKNLNSMTFPEDFEIEIKNTSRKPIYGIHVLVLFPNSKSFSERNVPVGLKFVYGDRRFISIKEIANSNDVPLAQGATTVLKSNPNRVRGLKERLKVLAESASSRVLIAIQAVSFGDGTGYLGKDVSQAQNERTSSKVSKSFGKNITRKSLMPDKAVNWLAANHSSSSQPVFSCNGYNYCDHYEYDYNNPGTCYPTVPGCEEHETLRIES